MDGTEELSEKNSTLRKQMWEAFKHGLEYEQIESCNDIDITKTEDKNLSFNEWFTKYYNE